MLRKHYLTLEQAQTTQTKYPVILTITQESEITLALKFIQHQKTSPKGLQLPLSLLQNLQQHETKKINYLSIILNGTTHINQLKEIPKSTFLEIMVPLTIYKQNPHLLEKLSNANRIILNIDKKITQQEITQITTDFISNKKYPLFANLPLCIAPLPNHTEIFQLPSNTSHLQKPDTCASCLLKTKCHYDTQLQFTIAPFTNAQQIKDLQQFLEGYNENTLTRF